MNRELVLWLLQQNHQPKYLKPKAESQQDTLIQGVKEAMDLRESNRADLSLELLQRLQDQGFEHPWILLTQANCLADMSQSQQAITILGALSQIDDPKIAQAAQQSWLNLQRLLVHEIRNICTNQDWACQHLPSDQELPNTDALLAVLNEVIATRESNRPELSLQLIETALKQGWQSPWLLDNQARALVHQGLRDEACTIWEQLQHHSDSTTAAEARRMLGSYQPHRISHPVRDQAVALDQGGQRAEAERVLLDGLTRNPEDPELWQLLESFQNSGNDASSELLEKELAARNRRLAAEERLLAHFESLLTPAG